MKRALLFLFAVGVFFNLVLADVSERANFAFFLDGGATFIGEGGPVEPGNGQLFLDLAAQARLGGNLYAECLVGLHPGVGRLNTGGIDVQLSVVPKFAWRRGSRLFLKFGLTCFRIYWPPFMGAQAGIGIERRLGKKFLLRLGGAFMPSLDSELRIVHCWKLYAGLRIGRD